MYNEMVLKQGGVHLQGGGEMVPNGQAQQWQMGNGLAPYGSEVRSLPTNSAHAPKRKI